MFYYPDKTPWTVLLAAVMLVCFASLPASAELTNPEPAKIIIYDPFVVEPMLREDSEDIMSGRAVHRRVITFKDSKHIDVGYNEYAKGVGGHVPYAYTKDEICYFPSGEFYVVSDGDEVTTRQGHFMWRPARAATQTAIITKKAVSICAFAPAREQLWAHRLLPSEVGKWSGDPDKKPRVVFYHYQDFKPLKRPGSEAYDKAQIIHRRIISKQHDNAVYMDASHDIMKAGLELGPLTYTVDQACWLESGEIELHSKGATYSMLPNQFMFRPAGVKTDTIKAIKDSVAICFFAPAIDSGWEHIVSMEGE